MKQKLKTIKLILTISLAGLLLFACQVDKDITNENLYEKNGVIMHKKFEELIKETQFKTTFEKIYKPKKGLSNKGGATSRTVMEDQYGFTISNNPANIIVSDSITSYTFLITRENTIPNAFENLIVNVKQNQDPKAYILKYQSINSLSEAPFNYDTFQGTKTLKPIIYNTSQISSKIYIECYTVEIWICNGAGQHASYEPGCTGHSGGSSEICTSGGGSGSGGGGSGSSSGGGGSNPNSPPNSNDTVVTAPVVCHGDCISIELDDTPPTPCDKVKTQITKYPTLQQELLNLATKTNESIENGISIDASDIGPNPVQNLTTGTDGKVVMAFSQDTQYSLVAHTHNSPANDTYSIFSWDDLLGISFMLQNNNIKTREFVFYVITADNTRYAMTINDTQKFTDVIFDFFNLPENFTPTPENYIKNTELEDYYKTRTENTPPIKANSTPADDKLNFLKFMKKGNIGADLFEVDPTFTNFTKLTLDNNNNIIPTPCSN